MDFDLFKKRNKIVSGFLIQNMRRGCVYIKNFAPSPDQSMSLDLGCLPYNARILATSEQGIMVFHNREYVGDCFKDLYHVCKPATKQVQALPNPKEKCTFQKFAIVVMSLKPLHYKIIKFSDHPALKRRGKFYTTYSCDIFDSMTWEWRSLNHINLSDGVFLANAQPITKSGLIYMLLTNNDILKFDAYSEKWKVFSSPIPYNESGDTFSSPIPYNESGDTLRPIVELIKYGGRLGLAYEPPNSNGRWEIWVLKMGQSWENVYVCKTREGSSESLKALYDADTSVMVDCHTLLSYRFKLGNNVISKVALNDIPHQIFSFRSDFEEVDLMHTQT